MSNRGDFVNEWRVALIGAGPGNPGLLTLRAVECLRLADLVLYDMLAPTRLLDYASATARKVCVEQLGGCRHERWPRIHQEMLDAVRRGERVVHLKGGDPLIFGRGGEQAEMLRQAGVPFEIVPGVTAALGAAAFAGIPLTHRDHASAVAFVTGHEKPEKEGALVDWAEFARFPGTLVIYMGMSRLAEIVHALIAGGKQADTPAAAVRWASTARQATVAAPLSELPAVAERAGLAAPSVVVVGPVVALREQLAWFEQLPLFGKTVLVTRPRAQAAEMVRRLELLGANVLVQPAVEIRETPDWAPVDQAIARLSSYQWLVFTSANGVHHFLRRLRETGRDLRALGAIQLAAIGPATAATLAEYHLRADLVPASFRSEDLAVALIERVRGQRVLLARADRGREVLRDELGKVATVEQVAVYSQTDIEELDAGVRDALDRGVIDYITLTSSNIARVLIGRLSPAATDRIHAGTTQLVTISPVTSATVRDLGLPVAAEASKFTTEGVVAALLQLASPDA